MNDKSSKEILKLISEYKKVQKDFKKEPKSNKMNMSIKLLNNNNFDTYNTYLNKHFKDLSDIVKKELEQKHRLRNISMWIAGILLALFFTLMAVLYVVLLIRGVNFSDRLLISLTVTIFTSIIGLMTIIFKYSFSRTKDTTDYLNNIIKKLFENTKK
jgi:hypothetical protein